LTLDPARPSAPAAEARNRRDNVEQVVIQSPQAGDYTIAVTAHRLATTSQAFSVAWSFAPVAQPPCPTVLSPAVFSVPQVGGTFNLGVTRPAHCGPALFENPTAWVTSASTEPILGGSTLKLKVAPADLEGTRHTLLRVGGQELRLRQSGPCSVKPLPESRSIEDSTSLYDCIYFGDYTRSYTFEAQAGQKVAIEMNSSDCAPWIQILAPGGQSLGSSRISANARVARIPQLEGMITLPVSGTYQVMVSGLDESYGRFKLNVSFGDREDLPGKPYLPVVVNECPYQSESALGDLSTDAGRRGDLYLTNVYQFHAFAGQKIEVALRSSQFDTFLYVVAPSGTVLSNDDATADIGSRIETIAQEGGTWRVEVSSFSPFALGVYQLEIKGCTARPKL
jgi:hypothetical protein